jgi:hypothetical protein
MFPMAASILHASGAQKSGVIFRLTGLRPGRPLTGRHAAICNCIRRAIQKTLAVRFGCAGHDPATSASVTFKCSYVSGGSCEAHRSTNFL